MTKILIHDVVNDVALIKTSFAFHVRYGVQVNKFDDLADALREFEGCIEHALEANGEIS